MQYQLEDGAAGEPSTSRVSTSAVNYGISQRSIALKYIIKTKFTGKAREAPREVITPLPRHRLPLILEYFYFDSFILIPN